MYTSFFGMNCNPFLKEDSSKYIFKSNDYIQVLSRLNYIKDIKGIALFYGEIGFGKTYAVRAFINSLNKDLYKIIYINATSEMTSFDFLKILTDNFFLNIGSCYRSDIYINIQEEIIRIVNKDKMKIIIVIDEAHLLNKDVFSILKVLYDFEMDSKDYVSLILVGYKDIKVELSKRIYESLNQRIIVKYEFKGFDRDEVKEYIASRLELANASKDIFLPDACNALYSCSRSSPRKLNTLVINALMLAFQMNKTIIDSEIVMLAKGEMDLK